MSFGAGKGHGLVSCTWESVSSSLDVKPKSALGSSSRQVNPVKDLGKETSWDAAALQPKRASAGASRYLQGCPCPTEETAFGLKSGPKKTPNLLVSPRGQGAAQQGLQPWVQTHWFQQIPMQAVPRQPRNRPVPKQRRNPVGPGSLCPWHGSTLLSIFNASEGFSFQKALE